MNERDNLPLPDFDREVPLAEQLTKIDRASLQAALRELIGPFRLVDNGGEVVLESDQPSPAASTVDITFEIDPQGRLSADCPPPALQAAARLVEAILLANHRYRMAAELHLAVAESDYEALRIKHTELATSEQRYRALATNLELRVKEQVDIIEKHQRQIYQAEKLASVGQLAAGVAHEINNPIGFVRGNLNTAADYVAQLQEFGRFLQEWAVKADASPALLAHWQKLDLDYALEDFTPLLRESITGVDRVARIVSALRDFSQIDQVETNKLDVTASIRAAVDIVHKQPGAVVEIDVDIAPNLPMLRGSSARLNLLLLNLLDNAKQAISPEGRIAVTASADAGALQLNVTDTGCGIAPEVLPRVFEPFFTTRQVGAGAGLGLTVSRDIVRALGGEIAVHSELGKGTEVAMRFPLPQEDA
ncbi:sensor histidine kinase [Andreprevotia chitinilytica]|uniref:sensor histidine kinase n=1 Tax=Andreprevotia chitinilytica TaxID=396808 RepID=UPI00068A4C38|nr:ATP-binding protein [Andreprevotia chitinilytica]